MTQRVKWQPKRKGGKPGKGQARNYPIDTNVDQWIEQYCVTGPNLQDRCLNLAASWQTYCDAHGLSPGHVLHLWQQLTMRGFPKARNGHGLATRHGLAVAGPYLRADNLAVSGRT